MKKTKSYSFYGNEDVLVLLEGERPRTIAHDFIFEEQGEKHVHRHVCVGLEETHRYTHRHTHVHEFSNGKRKRQSWTFGRKGLFSK